MQQTSVLKKSLSLILSLQLCFLSLPIEPARAGELVFDEETGLRVVAVQEAIERIAAEDVPDIPSEIDRYESSPLSSVSSDDSDDKKKEKEEDEDFVRPGYGEADDLQTALEKISQDVLEPIIIDSIETEEEFDLIRSYAQKENKEIAALLLKGVTLLIAGTATEITAVQQAINILNLADFQFHVHVEDSEHAQEASILDRQRAKETGKVHYLATSSGKYLAYDSDGEVASGGVEIAFAAYREALASSADTDEMTVRELLNELVRVWDLDQTDPNINKEAWLESPLQNRSATLNQGDDPIYIPIGDMDRNATYQYVFQPPPNNHPSPDSGFAGLLGDVNNDGVITSIDVNNINTILNATNPFVPALKKLRADTNGDGVITHMDALAIINFLNLGTQFPAALSAGIPVGEAVLVYHVHPNFHGVDTFNMEQVQGFVRRVFTVTMTVNQTPRDNNSNLIAQDQGLVTKQDTPRGVTLEAEDPRNENNPFTFEIVDGPDNGTLVGFNEDTGQVIYDPNSNFTGTDEFTFRVTEENPGLKKFNEIDACELELDSAAGKQYFIPCDWSGVYRANYDGTNIEKISGSLANARSLTLDLVNRNAYWVAERQVIRKSLDVAANIIPDSIYTDRVNAPSDGTMFAREIQIDPINGKLYLPHTAVMRGNTYRANLDGSGNFETLDSAGWEALIDYQNERIYWVNVIDATHSSIYSTDLDGNDRKFLIYLGRVAVMDLELDAANQQIYWVSRSYDNAEHKLQRINTDGSDLTDLVITNLGETGIGRMGESTFDALGLDLNRREIIMSGGIKPARVEFRVDLNTWTETIIPETLVSNIATVDINVIPDNLPPTANDQMVMTNEDTDVGIQLDGQDPEGDNLTYEIIDGPEDGTLFGFNPNTGQVTYRPDRNYNGDDSFTYRVTDNKLPAHILDNLEEFEGVLFPEAHSPEGLVFDNVTGKMYWHEHQGSNTAGGTNIIRRANIGGGDVETVLDLGQLSVNDLAIDEGRRLLFWTQHGTENGVPLQRIMRASLDDLSNAVAIHTVSLNHPSTIFTHLELDTANGQIYYLGSLGHDIRRINYDGSNDTFLLRTEFEDSSWSQTYGLALDLRSHERKMYWTLGNQSTRGEIHVANLDGSDHKVLMSGVARVGSIFVDTINDHLYWTINPFLASIEQRFQRMRINVPSNQQLVEDVLTVADTHGFDTVAFNDLSGQLCFGSNYNPSTHPPGTGIQAGIYCGNIYNLRRYSEVATVDITVKPVNDAPVTQNKTLLTEENTPVQTTLTGFDLDGDSLNFQIVSQPPVNEGSVACNGALCTFTPANGFSGVTSYTFRANDGTTNSNVSQVTVIVIPGNDPPQAFDQELETDKNTPLQIQLTGTDPDGDRLLYELLSDPANGTITGFNPQTGILTYVPNTDFVGMDEFRFKVTEINPNALDAAFIDLGTTTNYDAAVDPLTGEIYVIGRASTGQLGHLGSIYKMNADGSGKTVLVGPMMANGFFQIQLDPIERKMYWLETISDANGNRGWNIRRANLDGSQIETIRVIYGLHIPFGGSFIPAQQLHPSLELDPYNKKIYYTSSDGSIWSINTDGTDNQRIVPALESTDPMFDERYALVTRNIIVDPIAEQIYWLDARPTLNTYRGNIYVANLDGTNVREFNTTINANHDIDGFDIDPIAGTMNFITVTDRPNTQGKVFFVNLDGTGFVEVPTLRNFRQPNTGDGTTESFIDTFNNRYCWIRPGGVINTHEVLSCTASQASGPNLMSQPARIKITVRETNDPPVGDPQDVDTPEDTPIDTKVGSDPDGDTLNIMIIGDPTNGTVTCDQMVMNGVTMVNCTYTPDDDFVGMDMYEVKLTDPDGEMDTAKIKVNVTPVNDPPTTQDGSVTTPEDTPINFSLTGADIDGDPLTFMVVSDVPAAQGTLTCDVFGNCTYTPPTNFNGSTSFTYKANDGQVDSNISTFTLNVTPVNDPPTTQNQVETTPEDTPINFSIGGNDVEGDSLTLMVVTGLPAGEGTLSCIASGNCSYTPPLNFNGTTSFTFKANDGQADSNVSTVTINVTPVNDPPVAQDDAYMTDENTPLSDDVTTNDFDVDGDDFIAQLVSGASNGNVVLNEDGTFTYTPNQNYSGPDSFTYKLTENNILTLVDDADGLLQPYGLDYNPNEHAIYFIGNVGRLIRKLDLNTMTIQTITATETNGSTLNTNDVTLDPAAGKMYWAEHEQFNGAPDVKRANLDGTGLEILISGADFAAATGQNPNDFAAFDIALDKVNGKMYMAANSWILRSDLNGNNLEILLSLDSLPGRPNANSIALDIANGKMYWSGSAGGGNVMRSNLDGSNVEFIATNVVAPRDILLDLNRGKIFWTEGNAVAPLLPSNRVIRKSNLDGTQKETVVTFQGNYAGGLTFDTLNDRLCWTRFSGTGSPYAISCADSDAVGLTEPPLMSNVATVRINVKNVNDPPVGDPQDVDTPEDTPVDTKVGSDPNGDPLNIMVIGDPANGTVTCDQMVMNGVTMVICTYTPDPDFNGMDMYEVKLTDPDGEMATAKIKVNVTPVNDPPTTQDGSVTTPEDTPINFSLTGNDIDGDPLTFMVVSDVPAGEGTLTCDVFGNCTYTPPTNFNGSTSFTYKANDGQVDSNVSTFTVNVTPVNDAPTTQDQTETTPEDTPITFQLNGSDVEGDPLTFMKVVDIPAGEGTVTCDVFGNCTYTPPANFNGSTSFTFKANDGQVDSNVSTVTINVTPVNDAPTTEDVVVTTPENTPKSFSLVGNDVDGDTLSFMVVTDIPAGQGTVSCDAAGNCTYTPPTGFDGTTSFTYKANDGQVDSNISTVTINVTNTNDPPTGGPQDVETPEDTPIETKVGSDPNGDTLTIMIIGDPANGTVTCDQMVMNGVTMVNCTYTPDPDFNGMDMYEVKLTDPDGEEATSKIKVTVTPVNDAPTTQNQTETTPEDTPISFTLNGNDIDGDTLSYMVVTDIPAGQGTVNCDTAGNCTYTPPLNFNGSTSFTFKANDGTVDSNVSTVTINVTPVNDPPTTQNQTETTPEDTPISFTLNGNDVDGDTLSYMIVTDIPVSEGSVSCDAAGNCTYTPPLNFNGSTSFTFKANDGQVDSNISTVTLNVTPVNDAPTTQDNTETTPEDTPISFTLPGNDVDGDTLTYMVVTDIPAGQGTVSCDAAGNCTYTPPLNFNGSTSFTFKANDGQVDSNISTITINVTPVNDAPTTQDITVSTPENTPRAISLIGNDVDGDTLSFMVVADIPAGQGTVSCDAAGNCTYTPPANFVGTTSFTYKANDGQTDSNISTVTIMVNDTNVPPTGGDQTVTTPEDTPITTKVGQDLDGDQLTIMILDQPDNGTVTCDQMVMNGVTMVNCTYTPNKDFNGQDMYEVKFTDPNGEMATSKITVNVTPVNDPPTTQDRGETTPEDTPINFQLFGNDPDFDPLTFMVVTDVPSAAGTLSCDTLGACTYTPALNFNGTTTFTYKANDGQVDSNISTVTLNVTPVNDAPTTQDNTETTPEDTPINFTLPGNDVDGDTLTYMVVTDIPAGQGTVSCDAAGNCTYTPPLNFNGSTSFTYKANDGQVDSNISTITINVTPVNDAPTADDAQETTPEDTPVTTKIGQDVDGDTLTIMITDQPDNGTVSCDQMVMNGITMVSCTYTPDPNFNGMDMYEVKITDPDGEMATSKVTIDVTPVNDAPTADDAQETTPEDTPVTTKIGQDIDGDTLTIMITDEPDNGTVTCDQMVMNGITMVSCTYTPDPNFNGMDMYEVKITDPDGEMATAKVTIDVTPVNDPPVTQDKTVTTPEDTPINFTLDGSDVDGDTLSYMIVTDIPASEGSVSCDAAGNCTYTPPLNFNGSTSFTYKANDGTVDSNVSTVTINVTPVNDPPIGNDQTVTTPEDTPIDITNVIKDVSGDTLTLEIIDQPDNGTVSCSQSLVNGMTQVDCNYTPDPNFNGQDMFEVKGTDPGGLMATAKITVNVTPVNDAPTADDAQETTPEDTPVTTKIGQDIDGDTLTIMITDQPDNGSVTCDQMVMNGITMVNCTYTPDPNFNGMDMYEVKITDPDGEMATAKVTIDVTPVNDAPTTQDQTETTPEDTPITFQLNGADVDGDTLTFMKVTDIPAGEGTVSCDAAGECTYTPPLNFNGSTSFTFKANDGQVDSNVSTVTINVTPVNDPPTTQDQTETTPEDTPLNFTLNGNDVDGDTLSFMIVTDIPASEGSVSCDAAGNCTYTPPLNFNGSTSFTFKANDGQVDSNVSTVTINVTPVNDAPTADDAQETTPEETPVTTKIGQDVDGDTLTIMITDQPDNGTVTCDQMVMNGVTMVSCTYTPEKDFNGMDMYEVKITDPDGEMATAKVTIDVTPVNDAPEGFDHDVSTGEEETITVKNAQDVDGDNLQITINEQPQNGTLSCSQVVMNGVTMVNCDYTPNAGFVGMDNYKITVDDGQQTAMSTVKITVLDTKIPTGQLVINRGAEFTEEREVNILLIDLFDSSGIKGATYAIDGVDQGPLPGFVPGLPNQFLQGPHFLLPDVDGVHEISVTLIEDTPDEKVGIISDTIILRRTNQGGGGNNNAPVTFAAPQNTGPASTPTSGTQNSETSSDGENWSEESEGEGEKESENEEDGQKQTQVLVQPQTLRFSGASASITSQAVKITSIKSFNPFAHGTWFKLREGSWTFQSKIQLHRACSNGDQSACKRLRSRTRLARTRL